MPTDKIDRLYKKHKREQILYGVLTFLCLASVPFLNWWLVDRPLVSAIANSEFKDSVKVHGHYRLLVRPSGIVIRFGEIPGDVSGEKFVDMLTALAVATQEQAFTGATYTSIELARGGEVQFMFRGEAWKELAVERSLPIPKRAMLLVENLYLPDGKQALREQSDNLRILFEQKEKLFTVFYQTFVGKSATPSLPADP